MGLKRPFSGENRAVKPSNWLRLMFINREICEQEHIESAGMIIDRKGTARSDGDGR
jgi:hypothetical protein